MTATPLELDFTAPASQPTAACPPPAKGKRLGQIHAAHVADSPRLQRLLLFLGGREWASTREIIVGANICAVNSAVAEARLNCRRCRHIHEGGERYGIETRQVGQGRYEYRLARVSRMP